MAKGDEAVAEGLAKVAHAIRRSAALQVALSLTPAEGSVDDLLTTADRLARWVGGHALEQEETAAEDSAEGESPVGVPWHERNQA